MATGKKSVPSKAAAKTQPKAKSNPGPTRDPKPNGLFTPRSGGSGNIDPSKGVGSTPATKDVGSRTSVAAPTDPGTGGGGGGGGSYDPFGGAGGSGGGSFGMDLGLGDVDYLAGDAQYQAQLAALMKALQDSDADYGAQRGRYETSFGESLRGLGYTQPVEDDPLTPQNEAIAGGWNKTDLNTASGRALTNQQDDFAARGLLQSSLFARANDDLMRSLGDQLTGMQGARTSFLDDLSRQQGVFQSDNKAQQQQAKAEALARRAAGLSL